MIFKSKVVFITLLNGKIKHFFPYFQSLEMKLFSFLISFSKFLERFDQVYCMFDYCLLHVLLTF
jgi:hypothetical protein